MQIHIVTPAPPGSLHGNRLTALRWQRQLRSLGQRATVGEAWSGEDAQLLVALHAMRSHDAIAAFRRAHPQRPVVLLMTGTDLYRDLPAGGAPAARALASMEAADRLVLLQDEAIRQLPRALQAKAVTIHQSVPPLRRQPTPLRSFLVSVIGHLRDEKDPLCIVRALQLLPQAGRLRVVHLGKALDERYRAEAEAAMQHDPRYRWLGERPHRDAMRWLARSHLMVISSRMEGGAHVVSEAIAAGVPVLASDIPGNRGLLGAGYPGLFPVGDEAALAALLQRASESPPFIARLTQAVLARGPLVSPATERESIGRLLTSLGAAHRVIAAPSARHAKPV